MTGHTIHDSNWDPKTDFNLISTRWCSKGSPQRISKNIFHLGPFIAQIVVARNSYQLTISSITTVETTRYRPLERQWRSHKGSKERGSTKELTPGSYRTTTKTDQNCTWLTWLYINALFCVITLYITCFSARFKRLGTTQTQMVCQTYGPKHPDLDTYLW